MRIAQLFREATKFRFAGVEDLCPAQYRAGKTQFERLMERERATLAAAAPPLPRGELT